MADRIAWGLLAWLLLNALVVVLRLPVRRRPAAMGRARHG